MVVVWLLPKNFRSLLQNPCHVLQRSESTVCAQAQSGESGFFGTNIPVTQIPLAATILMIPETSIWSLGTDDGNHSDAQLLG